MIFSYFERDQRRIRRRPQSIVRPTSSYASGRAGKSKSERASPAKTAEICSRVAESLICRIRRRNGRKVSAAIERKLSIRPSRNFQSGALVSAVKGFRAKESAVTRHPRREECFRRRNGVI